MRRCCRSSTGPWCGQSGPAASVLAAHAGSAVAHGGGRRADEGGAHRPADIVVATETASGQGWRRPLLVWLGVSLKRAEAAGDTAEAARIQRRIAVVLP